MMVSEIGTHVWPLAGLLTDQYLAMITPLRVRVTSF